MPEAPGRVLTLVKEKNMQTWGKAFEIQSNIVPYIDSTETGYIRVQTTFYPSNPLESPFQVEVYLASEDNPHYLGPAPVDTMAEHIAVSRGYSGCNAEYLLALYDYLDQHSVMEVDGHLSELGEIVKDMLQLRKSNNRQRSISRTIPCQCTYHKHFSLATIEANSNE